MTNVTSLCFSLLELVSSLAGNPLQRHSNESLTQSGILFNNNTSNLNVMRRGNRKYIFGFFYCKIIITLYLRQCRFLVGNFVLLYIINLQERKENRKTINTNKIKCMTICCIEFDEYYFHKKNFMYKIKYLHAIRWL